MRRLKNVPEKLTTALALTGTEIRRGAGMPANTLKS